MSGQYFHRTLVAVAEVRRGVLAGLPDGAGGAGGHRPLLSSSTIMSGRTRAWNIVRRPTSIREEASGHDTPVQAEEELVELGALPPNPRNLALSGQNGCFGSTTIEALERRIGRRRNATRAPTQAPEWRGRLRAGPDLKSDPPILNLLRPKNGLDNGGHFQVTRIESP